MAAQEKSQMWLQPGNISIFENHHSCTQLAFNPIVNLCWLHFKFRSRVLQDNTNDISGMVTR